jgi:hypothetical protein
MRRTTTTPSDPAATTLPFWCLIPKGEWDFYLSIYLWNFELLCIWIWNNGL